MKTTRYILGSDMMGKTAVITTDKPLRFSCNIKVQYMFVNNDSEVVISLDTDLATLGTTADRDIFVGVLGSISDCGMQKLTK